jgi:hypothetical protein
MIATQHKFASECSLFASIHDHSPERMALKWRNPTVAASNIFVFWCIFRMIAENYLKSSMISSFDDLNGPVVGNGERVFFLDYFSSITDFFD